MALIFKGIAVVSLAACGYFGLQIIEADRFIIERLVRATDGGERRGNPPAVGSGARASIRVVADARADREPPATSKAFTMRAGPDDETPAVTTGQRLDGFAASPARMAQASSGSSGTAVTPPASQVQADKKPIVDDARRRLSSSIQVELKRVGCYAGEIDGDWGQASQRAMKDFNERIKATLPVNQPDYILLTLLQGHTATACGAACPRGEVDAGDGTCKTRAVVAENRLRTTPADPAPWAQSLAQIAGVDRSSQTGPSPTEADTQRTRLAAEQDRLRLKADAEARLQETARQATEARARSETARAEAAALAQRQAAVDKATADKAMADAERARIAAAEERRRQLAAELATRTEAERLASIAEAEKARVAADVNRSKELDALAVRAGGGTQPALQDTAGSTGALAPPAIIQGQAEPGRRLAGPTTETDPAPRRNAARGGNDNRNAQAAAPRFVARFVPPPTYRVGRLPPSPAYIARPVQRPAVRVFVSAPQTGRPNSQFLHLQRHSP